MNNVCNIPFIVVGLVEGLAVGHCDSSQGSNWITAVSGSAEMAAAAVLCSICLTARFLLQHQPVDVFLQMFVQIRDFNRSFKSVRLNFVGDFDNGHIVRSPREGDNPDH